MTETRVGIGRPDMRVTHCAYGYSVATNTRCYNSPPKYSLTVARDAAVAVAVPSNVHYSCYYKIKIYIFR
jgi:hypothetical protein